MLAAAEISRGEVQTGASLMEELAQEEPELFEPQMWLATAYLKLGKLELSLEAATRACQFRPFDANSRNCLGQAQKDLMLLAEAETSFRKACDIDANQPIYKFNLASVLQLLDRTEEAAELYRQAVAAASGSARNLIALGRSLLDVRQFERAAECGRRAVEISEGQFEARMIWGQSLMELGEIDLAKQQIDLAIMIAPDVAEPHTLLGSILNRKGLTQEAENAFRKSISLRGEQGHAYLGLAQVAKFSPSDAAMIETMRDLANEPSLSQGDLESLNFALGKAFEDLGDYQSAMRYYDEGNLIAKRSKAVTKNFNRDLFAAGIDWTQSFFTKHLFERLREFGNPSAKPIFIVGMVRSGTTLVEQIVSTHSDVEGAGEVEFWASRGNQCFDSLTGEVDLNTLSELTSEYLELLQRLAPISKRVTDKMPANILALGLIHLALPNARILLMRRRAIDNCLSIYTTANRAPVEFYHDKGNIAFAFQQYAKLADHWREVLPNDRLMTIDYEELVERPEEIIPAIIGFCDLEWDPRCLRPQENVRVVTTPSAAQVRQPIHNSSVDRWRRFELWLGELLTQL